MAEHYDIVVIGAGSAGMPLAICAAARGARVLVVENNDRLGGQLHWSSGQLSAAGSRLQAAKGIADSPDAHLQDALRISRGTADAAALRPVIDGAADTLHWLLDNGYEVLPEHPIVYFAHEPYSVPRTYFGPDKALGILRALEPQYRAQERAGRIRTLLRTRAVALIGDAERGIRGVRFAPVQPDGTLDLSAPGEALARYTVLATGGYARDPEKFLRWTGYPLYSWCSEHSRGWGHDLGLAVGGVLRHGEKFLCTFAGIASPKEPGQYHVLTHLTPQWRQPWELYVNLLGERFVREDEPSVDAREHALLGQPRLSFWAIYDQGIVEAAAQPFFFGLTPQELEPLWNAHASFRSAMQLDALAERCAIEPAVLQRTLREYNEAVARRHDPQFGRQHLPAPIGRKPPFYAVLHHGISVVGWAGLATDPDCRVLDGAGRPIPGLYAVGEVRGFGLMNGNAFIGGMGLQPALTMGRLLGQRLAA
ncbi:MAG: FAD-dependent oxidoreductase [Gammaproteobacteria bacterium]|nr:FAD-dependent oxidoreductase [Gammaproteobacteria bacterium]